jgi:hypothetical protein
MITFESRRIALAQSVMHAASFQNVSIMTRGKTLVFARASSTVSDAYALILHASLIYISWLVVNLEVSLPKSRQFAVTSLVRLGLGPCRTSDGCS